MPQGRELTPEGIVTVCLPKLRTFLEFIDILVKFHPTSLILVNKNSVSDQPSRYILLFPTIYFFWFFQGRRSQVMNKLRDFDVAQCHKRDQGRNAEETKEKDQEKEIYKLIRPSRAHRQIMCLDTDSDFEDLSTQKRKRVDRWYTYYSLNFWVT